MPVKVQNGLPARMVLEKENIFLMDESRAMTQDIRPLRILILNLMPVKEETETQLLRALSNTPLQLELELMRMSSHESTHTSSMHLNTFYTTFGQVALQHYDGMIITGAPVEQMEFEQVDYWEELRTVMDWSTTHVTSVLHICWGAQAGLYHHYGIPKYKLPQKLSGIYTQKVLNRLIPLVRGFDDEFKAPHSRYTGNRRADILARPELLLLAESEEAGPFLAMNQDGSRIFVMGHPEYDRDTLKGEYLRDVSRGLNPRIPENYFEEDDPEKPVKLSWRVHANTLYTNWLNYYVYQVTPYQW
ncbi:MAG: homoserine O-succinyltransferase [Lachnospiraceae bacterium]|jgi:homoserine O-succinyltransferase|nr:homoserine O-succinyltransferase [Lachnospiraceae bacterium]